MSAPAAPAGPVLLAIDAGGTAVKTVAFDLAGAEIAAEAAEVRTLHHPDGRVEREMEGFWAGTCAALRRLCARLEGREILALGLTGFGNGLFLLDAEGRGTRPGIVSVDHRAAPLVARLAASGAGAQITAETGHRLWGGQSLMLLAHLAQTEPDTLARTAHILACKDAIRLRLTGAALTDPTDASGGGMMDLARETYAAGALARLGLSGLAGRLPEIVAPGAVAGRVSAAAAAETGLPAGLPVAGGMMDVAACALGAGATGGDLMTMIAGTWSINSLECAAPDGPAPILNMLYRGHRLVAEGSPCSAANLGWFLETALGGRVSLAEANALVAAAPARADAPFFLPYVFGPAPLSGAFAGLRAGDDTGAMLRALCEGVAFQALRHAADAAALAGRALPGTIRLAGGAARSGPWAQIFADVTNRPVEAVRAGEVGALGAAICAAVAAGAAPDLDTAAARMTGAARRLLPDPEGAAIAAARRPRFERLAAALGAAQDEAAHETPHETP